MKAIIPKRVIAFLFGIDYVTESAESAKANLNKPDSIRENGQS